MITFTYKWLFAPQLLTSSDSRDDPQVMWGGLDPELCVSSPCLSTKNGAFTSSLYTVLYIRIYMDIYIYTWINKGDVRL